MKSKLTKWRLNRLIWVKHLGPNLAQSVNANCYYFICRDYVSLLPVSPHKNDGSIKIGVIFCFVPSHIPCNSFWHKIGAQKYSFKKPTTDHMPFNTKRYWWQLFQLLKTYSLVTDKQSTGQQKGKKNDPNLFFKKTSISDVFP